MQSDAAPQWKRSDDAGITLIEVLVVLVVIGVAAGATMMSIGGSGREGRAEAEAMRLAWHLSLAVDEALVTGRDHVLAWDEKGYLFQQYDPATGWGAAQASILARRHDLNTSVTLSQRDGEAAPVFIPSSAVTSQVVLNIDSRSTPWVVSFDGFTAVAMSKRDLDAGMN